MVSPPHEAMHRIFEAVPELITSTMNVLGVPLAEPLTVTPLPTDATEPSPLERRIDTLLRIESADSTFLLAIEAQGKKDPDKPAAWAYYLAYLYTKYKIPPLLLVTCQDRATALWAAQPVEVGQPLHPALTLRPLVLGPHNVPAITDPDTATANVQLAVLSAITHGKDPNVGAILKALATALQTVDEEAAGTYTYFTEQGLGSTPAANLWRQIMAADLSYFTTPSLQMARAEAKAEARAEAKADSILELLALRGIDVSPQARERISACKDLDTLGNWFPRALTATTADDLFTETETEHAED